MKVGFRLGGSPQDVAQHKPVVPHRTYNTRIHKHSSFPLKLLVFDQSFHQCGVGNAVMATDQKGIQSARIGIFHRRMLGQLAELPQRSRADPEQLAHFAGPVDRSRRDPLGQQQGVKLTIGLRPEGEGRGWCRTASQTARDGRWRVQSPNLLPNHPYATSSPPDPSPGVFRIGLGRGIGTSPPRLTVRG